MFPVINARYESMSVGNLNAQRKLNSKKKKKEE
jgi:hypothetical protein